MLHHYMLYVKGIFITQVFRLFCRGFGPKYGVARAEIDGSSYVGEVVRYPETRTHGTRSPDGEL